jgi:peptide-methionine (R)-S-oxide reductase
MNRRHVLLGGLAALLTTRFGHAATVAADQAKRFIQAPVFWRKKVSDAAWDVLFQENTEPPFSSPLNDEKSVGTYLCAACYQPLFTSKAKYDSGTGWPSFFQALPKALGRREDRSLFMVRIEYHCSRCGGHQGHVFEDGPKPTGLRYCNNGLALKFVAQGKPLPALRG